MDGREEIKEQGGKKWLVLEEDDNVCRYGAAARGCGAGSASIDRLPFLAAAAQRGVEEKLKIGLGVAQSTFYTPSVWKYLLEEWMYLDVF